jgi:hypothetical protein
VDRPYIKQIGGKNMYHIVDTRYILKENYFKGKKWSMKRRMINE